MKTRSYSQQLYPIMKAGLILSTLLLPFGAYACGGHGEVREWSQEEIDELEKKWGTDVRKKKNSKDMGEP